MRKFIEFIESIALIVFTAVLVVGVYKYIDSNEKSKEEDPIVDIEPDVNDGPIVEPIEDNEFTVEEYESQPVSRGNAWNDDWSLETRAKIYIKVNLCKGSYVKFIGDTQKYRYSVIETTSPDYPATGTFVDSGWNNTWDNPYGCYFSNIFDSAYLIITICHADDSALEDEEVNSMHSMFIVKGFKCAEKSELLYLEIKAGGGHDSSLILYEEGMTWGEWVESEYNTFGLFFQSSSGGLFTPNYSYSVHCSVCDIVPNAMINNTYIYTYNLIGT